MRNLIRYDFGFFEVASYSYYVICGAVTSNLLSGIYLYQLIQLSIVFKSQNWTRRFIVQNSVTKLLFQVGIDFLFVCKPFNYDLVSILSSVCIIVPLSTLMSISKFRNCKTFEFLLYSSQ